MTIHTTVSPTTISESTLAKVYVDGMPLEDLQRLYDYNSQIVGGTKLVGPNDFWASPARDQFSTVRDVIEVATTSDKLINRVSFLVARFPQRIWVQWYDADTQEWRPVQRASGRPVTIDITDCVPRRIYSDVYDAAHRHPHHRAAGHWESVSLSIRPIVTSRLRLVLARLPSVNTPISITTGQPTPYSLAVRDFEIGYEVLSPADAPQTPSRTQQVSETYAFATTKDILGSPVDLGLTQYDAKDLLWPNLAVQAGTPLSEAVGADEIWRCEPQPYPYAVVPLYVDARDSRGRAQVVDRFFLNTTTTGVGLNLYYSNDEVSSTQPFAASSEAIRYPGVATSGVVHAEIEGLLFPDAPSRLDLDQTYVQPDLTQPYWMGLVIQPQFEPTDDHTYAIISTPRIEITYVGSGQWQVAVNDTVSTVTYPTFNFNSRIGILIAVVDGQITIAFDDGQRISQHSTTTSRFDEAWLSANPTLAKTLRFGGSLTSPDALTGNYRLSAFVFKQEAINDTKIAEWLTTDPVKYLVPSDIFDQEQWDYTGNALVRISPYFQTTGSDSRNPYGVVGGPANHYETLTWTPINRDFVLKKGYLKFDPVKAKYFKFEFSNLSPQPYQVYREIIRKVRLFTTDTINGSMGLRSGGGKSRLPDPGIGVNMASSAAPLFSDQRRVRWLANQNTGYSGYTPTEALYSSDPGAQDRLAALNPAFRFQPWHRPSGIPRFTTIQRHTYEEVSVTHKTNVGYFVALSDLRMFRVDYTAADDTENYTFLFHDRNALDDAHDAHPLLSNEIGGSTAGIISPSPLPSSGQTQTTSEDLLSRRAVRGIQYATVQTPPAQVLPDPDFNDPSLKYWAAYGGARVEISGDLNTDIGSTIKVTRSNINADWDYVESLGSWDDIEGLDPSPYLPDWDLIENPSGVGIPFGGVTGTPASFFQPAKGGRIYAAARVYTSEPISQPIHLQIIGQEGIVLAEQPIRPASRGVTEWYCGYTLGSLDLGLSSIPSWDTVEAYGDGTWDAIEAMGDWNDVMGGLDYYTGPVTARLFQANASDDTWYVDNISLYEDPIEWEFSNDDGATWWPGWDIKNNPDGVLLFPEDYSSEPVPTATSTLNWRVTTYRPNLRIDALYLRPWYDTLGKGTPGALAHGGPNVSTYDQYPDLSDYAPFKMWDKPIPEDWWFNYRQWLLQGGLPSAALPPIVVPATQYSFLTENLLYQGTDLGSLNLGVGLITVSPIVFGNVDNLVVVEPSLIMIPNFVL